MYCLIFRIYKNFQCFVNKSNQLVFRIHFQWEAFLLKAHCLFPSHHLLIHNCCDLVVTLTSLCFQNRKGLLEFLHLIVPE